MLSVVAGNLIAMAQTNLKRMLAYSAIANVGFILLGFAAGTAAWLQRRAVLHAGLCADDGGRVRRDRWSPAARAARPTSSITTRACTSAIRCWPRRMAAVMFSTAGVPPFIGFWAKFQIIQAHAGQRPHRARHHRRGGVGDRRVLLPARGEADVLRGAGRAAGAGIGPPALRPVLALNALAVLVLGIAARTR